MNKVDFPQTLTVLKELSQYHPHIPKSELDLFLKSNESNFMENMKYVPLLYLVIQIIEKAHQSYIELVGRNNEKINLLHNIKNEPTKTILNYLKKTEMANALYSQIMFEDDTNYFPLIEKLLNDFKDNPSETMLFFQKNRDELDLRGGAARRPFENGYKDLYIRAQSQAAPRLSQEYFIDLKKEIIIDYYYEILQAYPIISKDLKQIQKKLYTSASIKIFKLLQFAQFPIKPYTLKNHIEELFIALEFPLKIYPDKIDEAYPFALYRNHYVYKYPNQENAYYAECTTRTKSSTTCLNDYCSHHLKRDFPYNLGRLKSSILLPIIS